MIDEHLSVALRALLGNQTQMMNALATLLNASGRDMFAKIILDQAQLTQRLCDGLDKIYGAAQPPVRTARKVLF